MPRSVVAMRCDDDESIAPLLAAIAAPAADARVLVKPNWVAGAPPPVTTSHALVHDVVRWLQPRPLVLGDMPTDRWNSARGVMEQADSDSVYRLLGVYEQFGSLPGVRIACFDQEAWVTRPRPPNGTWPGGIPIPRAAVDCDALVELIQLKTHWITGFSGASKGLMGLLPLSGTRYIHAAPSGIGGPVEMPGLLVVPHTLRRRRDYCDRIAAIAAARCPDLFVVDARVAFGAEGPGKGPVIAPRWVAVTSDLVAADLFCVAVLRWAWHVNLPTMEGVPIQDWYLDHASAIPPEHNGRIDDLVKFPLRRHPVIEADVACGYWPRLHEEVELQVLGGVDDDARYLAEAMSAEVR